MYVSGFDQRRRQDAGLFQKADNSFRKLITLPEKSDEERQFWASMLRTSYQKLFSTVELTDYSLTIEGLENHFLKEYGQINRQWLRRAALFFIRAATHAQIPLSSKLILKQYSQNFLRQYSQNSAKPLGKTLKTISLPAIGGQISIAGTFDVIDLKGQERDLVYKIIDLMTFFEENNAEQSS